MRLSRSWGGKEVDWKVHSPSEEPLFHFTKKKPGILGMDSGRLDETMRIGEVGNLKFPKFESRLRQYLTDSDIFPGLGFLLGVCK